MSRSPVREALQALESEGTLFAVPYSGTVVRPLIASLGHNGLGKRDAHPTRGGLVRQRPLGLSPRGKTLALVRSLAATALFLDGNKSLTDILTKDFERHLEVAQVYKIR